MYSNNGSSDNDYAYTGVMGRLSYLHELGVTIVSLSPIFLSGGGDQGCQGLSVYPLFESDASFLECLFVSFLVSRFFGSRDV